MTITLSRTSARPGESILAWTHLGDLDPTAWRLAGPSGTVTPAWSQPSAGPVVYWTHAYAHALTIPTGATPGPHTLAQPGRPPVTLTVTPPAPPRGKPATLHPGASYDMAAAAERQLAKGDVDLAPGRYDFDRPVRIPAGRRLRGHGALVVALGHFAFLCEDGATLEDLAVRGDGWLADVHPVPADLTLTRCHFEGLDLAAGKGLVTADCHWHRCGVIAGAGHYHLRPRFTGISAGSSCLIRGPGAAVVDGVWRDTDRGPVFQTHQADVTDCLLLHPDVAGLCHAYNGCEGVAAEGPGRFDRNTVLHARYRGDGPAYQITGPAAADNVLREFAADGGGGVVLDSGENLVERTTLAGGELRGTAGVRLGPNVSGARWWFPVAPDPRWWPDGRQEPTRLLGSTPTRGSQYGAAPPAGWRPVRDEGADNDTDGLEVVAALPAA